MTTTTRRQLLARLAPGAALALAALLPACGAATPTRTPIPAPFGARCPEQKRRPGPLPGSPYMFVSVAERLASSFAGRVREHATLIVLGTVREIGAARWTTPDGTRPDNPQANRFGIVTPVRVGVEQIAKGSYALPEPYLAEPGGTIGLDCAYYGGGSGPRPRQPSVGQRALYLLAPAADLAAIAAVPGDDRYHYHTVSQSYDVAQGSTITIGPEADIMGHRYDDPPRTLPVADALREIAAILATPATPAATSTR